MRWFYEGLANLVSRIISRGARKLNLCNNPILYLQVRL